MHLGSNAVFSQDPAGVDLYNASTPLLARYQDEYEDDKASEGEPASTAFIAFFLAVANSVQAGIANALSAASIEQICPHLDHPEPLIQESNISTMRTQIRSAKSQRLP